MGVKAVAVVAAVAAARRVAVAVAMVMVMAIVALRNPGQMTDLSLEGQQCVLLKISRGVA